VLQDEKKIGMIRLRNIGFMLLAEFQKHDFGPTRMADLSRIALASLHRLLIFVWSCSALPVTGADTTNQTITIDGHSRGRRSEGVGALSGGASSRLLIDYPEPQRSQVLDFLFKPRFGAALQHLKLEIGGDTQSTDGTEPSHARTRDEFLHPKPEYYQRGYEWWLLREARQRNSAIFLDVLQCGAPAWIGDGQEAKLHKHGLDDREKFYTQDNADFIAAFIRGAKKYHDLDIDFCGIWNEKAYDIAWIKLLRSTLNRAGLSRVRIVAPDSVKDWDIAMDMSRDFALRQAVGVVGVHYPWWRSSDVAKMVGRPLWASEDGFWRLTRDPWQAARILAQAYNRNYIQGRMTATIVWSLITSYFDNLPLANSGLMKANQPWSGHFDVLPAIWATAHTTQFVQPGWRYLDSACALLPAGGSHVAVRNAAGDFTIVIETMDAQAPQTVTFSLAGGLEAKQLHAWRTTQREHFVQLPNLELEGGTASVTLEPEAIYSFTTSTGQHKGGVENIPSASEFPLPYREDFESCEPGRTAKYLSDQGGVFEVVKRADGRGKCLRQVVTARTIDWSPMQWPYTLAGSPTWTNYEVSCAVQVGTGRVARLIARANRVVTDQGSAYALSVDSGGQWELSAVSEDDVLASGTIGIAPDTWHTLKLRCHGPQITAFVDQTPVAQVAGLAFRSGMVGVGAGGWYEMDFEDLRVEPITEPAPVLENLASTAKLTASSTWSNEFDATRANDGKLETRWRAARGHFTNEWLELDFVRKVRINTVRVQQFGARITKYKLQSFDGNEWRMVAIPERRPQTQRIDTFAPLETSKLRFLIAAVTGGNSDTDTPSVCEIEAYDTSAISALR